MNTLTSPLLTDLYQFTMLEAYLRENMDKESVFEFYVRALPQRRAFLVAAGLDSVLAFLESVRFSGEEMKYLTKTGRFSSRLLDYLSSFRFAGDVYALPEGTICFADEPLIRVVAPIPMAQLMESRLINLLHFETTIASKAVRCLLAAEGRVLVDFGLRRAHGAEAGMLAARASYIAGFSGTATVMAGAAYDIPLFGTMAHSYVEAYRSEEEAFIAFARANPGNVTFLIDTYDTLKGAHHAAKAAKAVAKEGIITRAVRLDSGDLLSLSKGVRRILDEHGFRNIHIFASGNLDEQIIHELMEAGAPIDGFGVGTKLDTSNDAPYLECAYKLTEYDGKPRMKKSSGKATLPGRKQVFRRFTNGLMTGDTITLEGDEQDGSSLMEKVMAGGGRLSPKKHPKEIAAYVKNQLDALPEYLRRLGRTSTYPVEISPSLMQLRKEAETALPNA
ncbi:MAG: nicotinate phosphoribosyltransferase [Syntrophales bacterium]|nr:nicotinate phosphoribosyltransferase [Syntrophales bacterium]